jgi:hypothetical protein
VLPVEDRSPYAFLTALDGNRPEDVSILRETRGDELKTISHMVLGSKLSTLYAFSGNGKTSLINAGLIPICVDLGYAVFKTRPRPPAGLVSPSEAFKECCTRENWVPGISESDPGLIDDARAQLQATPPESLQGVRRLLEHLDAQLTRLSASPESRSADLSAHLRRSASRPLPEFLESAQRFLGTSVPMVIICDQFEEIFVHYYNTPALDDFVDALGTICDDSKLRVHFLFSMREDWVGSMIAFRRVIPDVLNVSYRLGPIRRSKAAPALMLPASQAGLTFESKTAELILDDLCAFYRRQQEAGLAAVRLTPSPLDDPFIELPALQALGDRLWETRSTQAQPFTLTHYKGLVKDEQITASGSPAAAVLENYLSEMLKSIDDGKGAPDPALDDLRLDILYLLTDKVAHRRALGEKELLSQLRHIRPSALDLLVVDVALFRRAIEPLLANWLVREETVTLAESRFELAHDFVVRSVVGAWTNLDRRRISELAVLSQARDTVEVKLAEAIREREQVESKLAEITTVERAGLRAVLALPVAVMAGLLALMYFALDATPIPGQYGFSILWVVAAPALMLLAAAAGTRVRSAMVMAVLALASVLGLRAIQGEVRPDYASMYFPAKFSDGEIKAFADSFLYQFVVGEAGHSYEYNRNLSILLSTNARSQMIDFLTYASRLSRGYSTSLSMSQVINSTRYDNLVSYLSRVTGLVPSSVESRLNDNLRSFYASYSPPTVSPSNLFYGPHTLERNLGSVCFFFGILLMACYTSILSALSRRWPFSMERQQNLAVLSAETADIVVAVAFGWLCLWAVTSTPLQDIVIVSDVVWPWALFASALALYAVGTNLLITRTHRTPGGWIAGIEQPELAGASFPRLVARQVLFGLWAIPNMLWLLPAVAAGVLARKRRRAPWYHRLLFRDPAQTSVQKELSVAARSAGA